MRQLALRALGEKAPRGFVSATVVAMLAPLLVTACARDQSPLAPRRTRENLQSLAVLPAAQPPIETDCAILRVALPRAGGVTTTVEAMPACTSNVLPVVVSASYNKGVGSASGSDLKPLTLSLAIRNGTNRNEYGEPAALLIDLAHSVVERPLGLAVTGKELARAGNADGTAPSSDQLAGAAFWMYTGLLDQDTADPSARLEAGEQSGVRQIQLRVLAGVEEFTVPVYARMRVIAVASVIGGDGGVLEHPAGASVTVPAGAFSVPAELRIESVDPIPSELSVISGSFQLTVTPLITPSAPTSLSSQRAPVAQLSGTIGSSIVLVALKLNQTVTDARTVLVQAASGFFQGIRYGAVQSVDLAKQEVVVTFNLAAAFTTRLAFRLQAAVTGSLSCDDQYQLFGTSGAGGARDPRAPVIYIHGIQFELVSCFLWKAEFDPASEGTQVFDHLNDIGLGVTAQYWRYTYPTFNSIDDAARHLATDLAATFPGRSDIVIVAHSMGGLVARLAIVRYADVLAGSGVSVKRLVTLGTPHSGTPVTVPVFWLSNTTIASAPGGLAPFYILTDGAKDLQTGSQVVQELAGASGSEDRGRYFTFGGITSVADLSGNNCAWGSIICDGLFFAFSALGVASDGVVEPSSAFLDGSHQMRTYGGDYDHLELHTGDFTGGVSGGRPVFRHPDPLLAQVASVVADGVAPSPTFISFPGRLIRGIAYDAGAVWITHSEPTVSDVIKISKINSETGAILGQSNDLNWNGRGITVGGGSVWVADALADVIHRVDPSNFNEVGSPFSTPGTEPTGIAFDGTDLWLSDPFFQRVYHLSTSGAVLPGGFSIPNLFRQGLEWDGTGFWTNTGPTEQSHYLKNGTIDGVKTLQGLPSGTSIGDIAIGNGKVYLPAGDRIYIQSWQPLAPPGNLGVFTVTSVSNLDPDGYIVTVDGSSSQAIGINGSVTFTALAAGDHTVELSGIASSCAVIGPNRRTVRVPGGGAAVSTFNVSCGSSTRAQPTLRTSAIPTTATVGEFLNDVATLASGASPSGVIDFLAFGPNATCPDQASLVLALAVNGNGDYSTLSVPQVRLADRTGTWHWIAIYEGDANNWPANSGCDDEPVTVN